MAFHQRWILLVALAGRGSVRIDRNACRLGPGRALLIPPLRLHNYEDLDSGPIDWLFITFDWPGQAAHSTRCQGVRKLGARGMYCLGEFVTEWLTNFSCDATILAAKLHALLQKLCPELRQGGAHSAFGASNGMRRKGLLDEIIALCRDDSPPAIDFLAGRLGISSSHLRARFRIETGVSLGRYLRENRLRAAALALRETGSSVKEVAERFGYPDLFTFSKSFKKTVGVTPSHFSGSH